MVVSYKKLFHMLIDKDMTAAEPQKEDRFSANIPTRLRNNSYVSLETMEIIVSVLD